MISPLSHSTWNDTIDSDQYVAAHLRSSIEPLLLRYRGLCLLAAATLPLLCADGLSVDAAFWGHHHRLVCGGAAAHVSRHVLCSFQRTCAVAEEVCAGSDQGVVSGMKTIFVDASAAAASFFGRKSASFDCYAPAFVSEMARRFTLEWAWAAFCSPTT